MSVWMGGGGTWALQDKDTDIMSFQPQTGQPTSGRSILIGWDPSVPLPDASYVDTNNQTHQIDWTRIVAVEIDEPYGAITTNPCAPGPAGTAAHASVNLLEQNLSARAQELKSKAPWARFWVNFTAGNIYWMMHDTCGLNLNKPYIDVISLDLYHTPFNGGNPDTSVEPYYQFLLDNPATPPGEAPHQQLALIPGTFYRVQNGPPPVEIDHPSNIATILNEYFTYAEGKNQVCDLSLGSRGPTGIYDGCRVWLVMGFLSHSYTQNGVTLHGLLDPDSSTISQAWRLQSNLPVRPDLAPYKGPALQLILDLLLDD